MKKLYTLLAFAVVMLVAHDSFAQLPTPLYAGYRFSATMDEIDTTGGTFTVVSSIALSTTDPGGINSVKGITTDPTDDQVYILYQGSGGSGGRRIGTVDVTTGSITDIGNCGQLSDIEFGPDGTLYGAEGGAWTDGVWEMYDVNKTTGTTASILTHISGGDGHGICYNPFTDLMYNLGTGGYSTVDLGTFAQTGVSGFQRGHGSVFLTATTGWVIDNSNLYDWNSGTGTSFNSSLPQTYHALGFGPQPCDVTTVDVTDDMVCTGDMVTLTITSTPTGTMTWDGGITDGVPFVPATGVTTYTATSTDPMDCEFVIDIFSTDVPTIVPNASDLALCELVDLTLFGSGGDAYSWDMGVDDNVAFVPASTGITTYTLTGSLLGCEAPSVTIDVEVVAAPDVTGLATPNNVCIGETFVLTSGGTADTYDWGAAITEGVAITADDAGTFVYTVVGTDASVGCINSANVTVEVNAAPIVTATATETVVCEGEEVTFTGGGADTYTWDSGVTDGSPMQLITPGVFTFIVIGADDIGCEGMDEIVVTVLDAPEVSGVVSHSSGIDGAIDVSSTGGSGAISYVWDHGPTTEDLVGLAPGDYTVTATDGACSVTSTFTVINVLSLDGADIANINVFPNPTSGNLNIELEGQFAYELVAINGTKVLVGNAVDTETLSLDNIADGIYVLNVNTAEGAIQVRVVKK